MSGPYLGRFELSHICTHDGCEDEAEHILILFEPDTEDMTVCCLCTAHTVHHEALFDEPSRN